MYLDTYLRHPSPHTMRIYREYAGSNEEYFGLKVRVMTLSKTGLFGVSEKKLDSGEFPRQLRSGSASGSSI